MTWRAFLLGLFVLILPKFASADDAACVSAHRQAQVDRKAGRLKATKKQLAVCSSQACPTMITSDCTEWIVEVERALPSVVIAVTDAEGHDKRDVRVFVDGELVTERLDGSALPIDPGEHRLRFELVGSSPIEQVVIVREGERARAVHVGLPRKRTALSSRRSDNRPASDRIRPTSRSPLPYVLGVVGVVALGASGYFYYRGLSKKSELDDQNCRPSCDPAEVDSGKRSILIADIAAGVAVVALGSSIVWIATTPKEMAVAVGGRF